MRPPRRRGKILERHRAARILRGSKKEELMPITWRRELSLSCESCSHEDYFDDIDAHNIKNPTPKTFERIAKKRGWKIVKNKCWCPNCSIPKSD